MYVAPFRRLAGLWLVGALVACSEVSSLTSSDPSDEEPQAISLTADNQTVPAGGSTTLRLKVTRKSGEPVRAGTKVELQASRGRVEPTKFRTEEGGTAAIGYRAPSSSGPDRLEAVAGKARAEMTLGVETPAPSPPPAPAPAPPPVSSSVDLRAVVWVDVNVASWPETSRITSVTLGDPPICIYHTKAGQWPTVDGAEGNPWVIANVGGRWYAATYEWLASGQVCKGIDRFSIGPHIGRPPLSGWVPRSGETIGLMVSARARFRADSVQERSNIVVVQWP